MVIYKGEEYVITYNKSLRAVVQKWENFTSSNNFRQAIEKTLDFFKNNEDVFFIISDTQKHGVVSSEDSQWVTDYINPQLIKNGLRKLIFIEPENIFAQLSVTQFLDKNQNDSFVIKVPKFEFAEAWVKQYLEVKGIK